MQSQAEPEQAGLLMEGLRPRRDTPLWPVQRWILYITPAKKSKNLNFNSLSFFFFLLVTEYQEEHQSINDSLYL